ncbi:CBO0543 family protein [Robertmurraya massiliosenegalensis]|uniref:CBO0543 family protein n=1 Tax=Robertmurraya massiliosenegalensis TaxID=1287657 RepID=UPI0002E79034|nr:CBO0543 family protein [Robertmurraya massiliosenegalensis]
MIMKASQVDEKIKKVYSLYHKAHDAFVDTWLEVILFTPRWWLGLGLSVIPWILWVKLHNQQIRGDLIRAGFFMAIIALILDSIGLQFGLWLYPYNVFPFITAYLPWDLSLLPISIMFMIEIFPNRHPFIKGIIYGTLAAFIGEPIAIWLDLYEPLYWKSIYSFPIYILLFLLCNQIAKSKIYTVNTKK